MTLELCSVPFESSVVAWGRGRSGRFREAADAHDAGTSEIFGVSFEKTEQPVVLSSALNPNLVESGEVVTHGLPFAAT